MNTDLGISKSCIVNTHTQHKVMFAFASNLEMFALKAPAASRPKSVPPAPMGVLVK